MPLSQSNRKRHRSLPLPTLQENDAMIGQTFWKESTGKGLEALARSGQQKLNAIRREARQAITGQPRDKNDANNTSNDAPLRTPKEQNAVTGDLFYKESTGANSGLLARQVKARETEMMTSPEQRRAARHGRARAGLPPRPEQPLPADRVPGQIYVTQHRVLGKGPYHTAIEYTPVDPNPKAKHNTKIFSAGPQGINPKLDNARRETDVPTNNQIVGIVKVPPNLTPQEYVKRLEAADKAYCDCANYDYFPERTGNHNSNSYTRGMIEATGGQVDITWDDYVGGSSPLPSQYFEVPQK